MHIKRAKQEIRDTIEAYLAKDADGAYVIPPMNQRPVLLMGPPGIGKTQIVSQVARECHIALVSYTITHHTRQSAIGLPFVTEKTYDGQKHSVTEYTMSEIIAAVYDKMEETKLTEGILFIDEINCVSETLAPAMLQFLQCKTFGNQAVPAGWLIVAAGNPPEYNQSVRDFDVVTLDRVKRIDVEENYEVWKEYAYQADIHPAILSYLEMKPENFYRVETTVDGKAFVTARGWEDLSRLLKVYDSLGKQADRAVIVQYLQHETIARDFAIYLQLYHQYQQDYGLDKVLSGSADEDTVLRCRHAPFDERLSVVEMLIARLGGLCRETYFYDRFVTLLYEDVKILRDSGDLSAVAGKEKETYEALRRAEQLTREEDHLYRRVGDFFDDMRTKTAGVRDVYPIVKEAFEGKTKALEQRETAVGDAMTYAFDFLTEAMGESQELVVFVTELNTNFYTIQYLKSHECPAYQRYNQKLLVPRQREQILTDLDELE